MPFIIGTAGHIDHGKTSLIKALTGTDTDRLKEEKERGISIDLGFAQLVCCLLLEKKKRSPRAHPHRRRTRRRRPTPAHPRRRHRLRFRAGDETRRAFPPSA